MFCEIDNIPRNNHEYFPRSIYLCQYGPFYAHMTQNMIYLMFLDDPCQIGRVWRDEEETPFILLLLGSASIVTHTRY